MPLPDIFSRDVSDTLVERINLLQPDSTPRWGKMSVAQMLAHCNVTYEMIFEKKHPKPNFLMQMVLTLLVKKKVTDETPYAHNLRTAPAFLIKDEKDFEKEKNRLIDYINRVQQLGENYFVQRSSHSFGRLTREEWNNMFYKHLDHHLMQFGV